ncbi:hypothetical protein [Candidatus Uabimicrobium amorphum]|uniref:Uncharacterized protein n=1 Tax=Uabimicrobium amorphum TaxID=2596890 RepID=A0A5S9F330_UABAM|nr:hypothetical protein [Candidatus Uabimicrobium amorphum]BBM82984.1 hypothetical protein UABAM_01327 [Candidatus Uabimicrobium amorphum]
MFRIFLIFALILTTSFVFCDDDDPIEELGDEVRELLESIEESDEVSENWHKEVRERAEEIQRNLQEILRDAFRERLEDEVEELQERIEEEEEEENEEEVRELRGRIKKIQAALEGDHHKKLRSFIKEYLPEMATILQRLQKENPEEFEETIDNLYEDMEELEELKRENPDMFALAVRAQRHSIRSEILADRYRETKDEALKKQLLESLNIVFDTKIAMQKHEMQHLVRELQELKERLTRKVTNKGKIIQQRFEEMTGQTDFDW